MASGRSLQGKITSVLRRVNATDRVVSFRTRETVGGDSILGLGSTETLTDTVMDPQPALTFVRGEMVARSGGLYQLGDYDITIAGTVSEATLKSSTILYGTEELKIIEYVPSTFQGVVAAWQVVARASKGSE